MRETHLVSGTGSTLAEPLTFEEQEILERAVAKIVLLGELVGVTADQMTLLLESGLTVSELLEYLAARTGELVGRKAPNEGCGEAPEGG